MPADIKCRLCGTPVSHEFTHQVLRKHEVAYYRCPQCGLLQTEQPFWLPEAYDESINVSDAGLVQRNLHFRQLVALILFFLFGNKGRYLDYGGGYGLFVRLMRDLGFDFYWRDAYTKNLLARGFEGIEGRYSAVVALEVIEHLVDPLQEIEEMARISDVLILSTSLYGDSVPEPEEWGYYGFGHGQHISFYNVDTLKFIAAKCAMNLYTDGACLHILSRRKLPWGMVSVVKIVNKIGGFYLLKKLLKSKTQADWALLSERDR
jgi:hypothetical protein